MILPSTRQSDPNSAVLRLVQDAAQRPEGAPVANIVARLATDRPYMIAATVENNPTAVKQRLLERTGRDVKVGDITKVLMAMEAQGKQGEVSRIIAVPFLQGNGTDLEKAFAWVRGEVSERVADPNDTAMQSAMRNVQRSQGAPKSGPYYDDNDIPDGQTSGGNTTTGEGSGDGFDWTILLNTLPGLIAAFTGAGQQGQSTTPTYVPPPKQDNTLLIVTIIGALAVVGMVIYFITRKK